MIVRPENLNSKNAGWRTIQRGAEVAQPFQDVASLLATDGGELFGTQPGEEGRGLELRVRQAGAGVPRTVLVHVGGFVHLGDRMLVPVSWADYGRPRLFTVLKAVIEVVPAGEDAELTQITLLGRYRPPLGRRGEESERRSGADIVAEAVTSFVTDLAARVEAELAPAGR